jgi:tetrahydromethanopterin S-methyltransferase subunit C
MNRVLAMILVVWGAGLLLLGLLDAVSGELTQGRIMADFVIGPAMIAIGFVIDRRTPKPPKRAA